VKEDRRGITFEGLEAGHPDPEGTLNLEMRPAWNHLVLSVRPLKDEVLHPHSAAAGRSIIPFSVFSLRFSVFG